VIASIEGMIHKWFRFYQDDYETARVASGDSRRKSAVSEGESERSSQFSVRTLNCRFGIFLLTATRKNLGCDSRESFHDHDSKYMVSR
jgi:hypothetical protein